MRVPSPAASTIARQVRLLMSVYSLGRRIAPNRCGERWKAGTACANFGGNRRILLRFFNTFDSLPELAGMTALRRTQLIRFGVWSGLATLAVLVAVVSARTESGVRRIATLISPEPPAAARSAKDLQLANRALDQEAEQRRLSEAIRILAADRDRLLARVTTLERNVEDVTGSIGQPAAKAPVAQLTPMPAPSATPAPSAAAPTQTRVAAGHLATGSAAARGVGRNKNRLWRRSRREHDDRRAAHALGQPEGEPARAARRAAAAHRVARRPERRIAGTAAGRRPARQCGDRGAPVRGSSPPPVRPASRPCSTDSGWRCSSVGYCARRVTPASRSRPAAPSTPCRPGSPCRRSRRPGDAGPRYRRCR